MELTNLVYKYSGSKSYPYEARKSFIMEKIVKESQTQNLEDDNANGINHAENLTKAMVAEFGGLWYVVAMEEDEYNSSSGSIGSKDYWQIICKGVKWKIFSYHSDYRIGGGQRPSSPTDFPGIFSTW